MAKVLLGLSSCSVARSTALRLFCGALLLLMEMLLTPQLVIADTVILGNAEPQPPSAFYRLPQYAQPQLSPSGR